MSDRVDRMVLKSVVHLRRLSEERPTEIVYGSTAEVWRDKGRSCIRRLDKVKRVYNAESFDLRETKMKYIHSLAIDLASVLCERQE